jgi:3-oxoadipate enol-lactonase
MPVSEVCAAAARPEPVAGPPLPPARFIEQRGGPPIWVYESPGGPPQAPVLMLLHGLGASAALNWYPAFEALSAHFRVVAPDHRGHGRTPSGDCKFTLEACAEDGLAVADALGIDRFIAVGYSMGGPIAQLLWRTAPQRVEGLVLAATSRDFRGRVRDRIAFQILPIVAAASRMPGSRGVREVMFRALAPRLDRSLRRWAATELRRADPRRVLEAATQLGRFTSRTWIGDVDVPTSVIVSMNDQVVPVRRQLKLARSIEGSVAAFVNGDHYVAGSTAEFVPTLIHECLSVARRSNIERDILPAYWEHSADLEPVASPQREFGLHTRRHASALHPLA